MAILGAILAIGLLIVVHEAGHYFIARLCKMRVERFSLGFGPALLTVPMRENTASRDTSGVEAIVDALFDLAKDEKHNHVGVWRTGEKKPALDLGALEVLSRTRSQVETKVIEDLGEDPGDVEVRSWEQTDFTLAPIPFGGFVQINGMTIIDEDVDPDDSRAYPNRPVWQRFATIFAGPATNYLFAVVIALGLYFAAGVPSGTTYFEVANLSDGFDAVGKLEVGDRIVGFDGKEIYAYRDHKPHSDLADLVNKAEDNAIALTVIRGGEELQVSVTPKLDRKNTDEAGNPRYRLGIKFVGGVERIDAGIAGNTAAALKYPVLQTQVIVDGLWKIITREEKGEVGGPVKITAMISETFRFGWIRTLEFLMLLNVYLGLFNLLPLPALDGGRLVFLGYEMATRKRANPRIEATVHMVGIMALLVLMVLVTYNDIRSFF